MAGTYAVLIGDIIGSRNIADRDAVQRQFKKVCNSLNKEAKSLALASPFTITLGDEFQAVFSDPAKVWACLFQIEAGMTPHNLRFAVGIDEISTKIRRDTALGMDGPAFYRARTAMELLKKKGLRYRVAGLRDDEDFCNSILDLISHNRDKWKKLRVITLAKLLKEGKQIKQISRMTGSTEQAVYRNIRDGALDTIVTLLEGIRVRMTRAMS